MAERIDFRDQISANKWKSFFLMAVIFAFIIALAYAVSYAFDPGYFFTIMIFAIIFSIGYTYISYYFSDKIAIASVGAREADRSQHRQYYNVVEGLTIASGLPMPKLCIMNSQQINAFASGRDPKHAVVCVTMGALDKLDRKELEGVLAHELSHVADYDIRYMTLAAVMVGMIAIISQIFLRSMWFRSGDNRNNRNSAIFMFIGILLAILAPIAVKLVQLAISRKREYTADATAVKFTRYPGGLISALKKIRDEAIPERRISKAVAPLFFASPIPEVLSTHPPIEKRIDVLEKM